VNRRTTVKSILALGAISITSFSIFKWLDFHKKADLNYLRAQKRLIEELSEMIIPQTDTPGAKEAKVADAILKTVVNCLDFKEQNTFIIGLQNLENYCMNKYQSSFITCKVADRADVLTYFDEKEQYSYAVLNKVRRKLLGPSFFFQLKELTVFAYCTSEIGATKGLAYDYMPVSYEACIPLRPNQQSWATK
jgi:hypothetical protein